MGTVRVEFLFSTAHVIEGKGTSEHSILQIDVEEGEKVRTLLDQLVGRYPRIRPVIFDATSANLNEEVTLFLNGQRLELLNGLETKLKDGDVLSFLPFISGG